MEKMKYLILILLLITVGCGKTQTIRPVVEKVPVIYTATPPADYVDGKSRPEIEYFKLTPEQKSKETVDSLLYLVKILAIDLKSVTDYSEQLEVIINKYASLAKLNGEFDKLLNDPTITTDEKTKLKGVKEWAAKLFTKE